MHIRHGSHGSAPVNGVSRTRKTREAESVLTDERERDAGKGKRRREKIFEDVDAMDLLCRIAVDGLHGCEGAQRAPICVNLCEVTRKT